MPIELFWSLLRHRHGVICGALAAVIVASWGYLWLGAGIEMEMREMGGGQIMAMPPEWSLLYAVLIFVMWAVMMAAMMLPGAAPTVLLVAVLAPGRLANSTRTPAMAVLFASGYLLAWSGFSLAAMFLQWRLDAAGLLSETMALSNATLANAVLIAAGVYQWTPGKDACLRHCRSPANFLLRHWRQGTLGAVSMGTQHGLFCLGCCWMLMALLFVGGLMNLAWIGAIAALLLLEKTIPWGGQMSRLVGALLVAWGVAGLLRII